MPTRLLSIGTAVPSARLDQAETRGFFVSQPGVDRLTARLIGTVFDHSAIDGRYSVIGGAGAREPLFADADDTLLTPSTGARNALYRREAPALFAAAARAAVSEAGVEAADITHVITASCTGCFAPGPDYLLVRELGIPPSAERTHIGFMGCAAAFPALRTAARACEAAEGAVVLVVCAELCSIHIRSSSDPEQIVASAVFGDGAAAAVLTSGAPRAEAPLLEVGAFATGITSEGEQDMDWTIGDQGFEMRLTAEVPRIIGREIAEAVGAMIGADAGALVDGWAVHPGGRSVLDRVESGLGLDRSALDHSRAVLRDHGNMSSATILFILRRFLHDDALADGSRVAGLCFGPGLTIETALFTRRAEGGGRRIAPADAGAA
ncbi:3-oxoacyl-[acyl-carrier-protein] synthase III C-terminal domain-containing protein [Leucobacter sp. gxy201]|uniref:type III polyketide synthase n=1 Tax=Leucobacter sp. gxy201 TaxID=2957200 RepID=UPI003D9FB6F7